VPTTLEFWPDYGGQLLVDADRGTPISLTDLDLPSDLAVRAETWLGEYEDDKLTGTEDAEPDEAWHQVGRRLFSELKAELDRKGIALTDWEGVWDASATTQPE
jgi:hypothetical protein